VPATDPAPPAPRFRIWIRRQAITEGPYSVRFEVFDGKGLLRVARPGVLIDPPARPLGFEERLTANQLRTSRFLLVWDAGRARQGFLLGRLDEAKLEAMDADRWSELETHVEGGFRYLVIGVQTGSQPPPVKAPTARRPSLAELRQALDRMTVDQGEVDDDPDSAMDALTGKAPAKPKAADAPARKKGPTVPLESAVTLPGEDFMVEPDSDPITPGIVQSTRSQRRARPAPVNRLAGAKTVPPAPETHTVDLAELRKRSARAGPPAAEPPPTDEISEPSASSVRAQPGDESAGPESSASPVARFYESIAGGVDAAFGDDMAAFAIDESGGRAPGEHSTRREIGDAVTMMPGVAVDELPGVDLGAPGGDASPAEEAPGADDDLIAVGEATEDELSDPEANVAELLPAGATVADPSGPETRGSTVPPPPLLPTPLERLVATPPEEAVTLKPAPSPLKKSPPWAVPSSLAEAYTTPPVDADEVDAMHRGTNTLVRHLRRQNGDLRAKVQELEARVLELEALLARAPRAG
jgi:hypothetical protein